MNAELRQRVRVEGRVQGVGFRWFTQVLARELGVRGWVKNLRDGSVLCEAQAAASALVTFVERLRSGPTHARVERVEVEELPLLQGEAGFEVT